MHVLNFVSLMHSLVLSGKPAHLGGRSAAHAEAVMQLLLAEQQTVPRGQYWSTWPGLSCWFKQKLNVLLLVQTMLLSGIPVQDTGPGGTTVGEAVAVEVLVVVVDALVVVVVKLGGGGVIPQAGSVANTQPFPQHTVPGGHGIGGVMGCWPPQT
jgi:hypothetical protein